MMAIRRSQTTYFLPLLLMLGIGLLFYVYTLRSSEEYSLPNQDWTRHTPGKSVEVKRVLVTGAAGFIGFHLASILAKNQDNLVVGVDNFNDYYDVKLKVDRAYELEKIGVTVYNDDLCNADFLEDMMRWFNFSHVVHLGAQAGVRYSLAHPLAYVRNNVECYITLLDVFKNYPSVKIVYASSSSVYGKTAPVPFRLSASIDHPGNMYAASKASDEYLSLHYCWQYNMQLVGLRFFTVYGTWGRPDMAVYKFAESILEGRDVPMYHVSDDNPLGRDFTYIDDVVDGIMNTLDYIPTRCGEKFNLGFGNPVSVPGLVEILQEELDIPAKIKKLPLPPTEILRTWADTSVSKAVLGFSPTIDLRQGVKKFVTWFKEYRTRRAERKKTNRPDPADEWFQKITEQRDERNTQYKESADLNDNQRMIRRLQHEKTKYFDTPNALGDLKDNFFFYQGQDSPGGNLIKLSGSEDIIQDLKDKCAELEECIAFTSDGMLKQRVGPKEKWTVVNYFVQPRQGLYVADLDMCQAGLHECAKNAACIFISHGRYTCVCTDGYYGDGHSCVPRYENVQQSVLQQDWLATYYSARNVSEMKQGKSLIFHQGLDSPGGDYIMADIYKDDNFKLQELCSKDPVCIGVKTNGMMKAKLDRKANWIKWSNNPEEGIYIFDLDYCALNTDACPEHSVCQTYGAGDFRCECEDDYVPTSDGECSRKPLV